MEGDGYTKTSDYALRVTESITEIGKFAVLSREDTAKQVSKTVTSSGRRDTEEKLKKVEEDVPIPEIRAYGAKAKATLVKAIKDGGGKVPPEYE